MACIDWARAGDIQTQHNDRRDPRAMPWPWPVHLAASRRCRWVADNACAGVWWFHLGFPVERVAVATNPGRPDCRSRPLPTYTGLAAVCIVLLRTEQQAQSVDFAAGYSQRLQCQLRVDVDQ